MNAPAGTASTDAVNPHYLNHVVKTSETHDVAVSEDILTGNGIKLLAKGARIDASTRERLLRHKLAKPLEDCIEIVNGIIPARFEPVAAALLAKHPLLNALCESDRARAIPASLGSLTLSMPMQSLLTVYGQQQEERVEHAVGVSMLAMALGRRLLPGEIDRHRMLATAGLVHDVGELYIDPALVRKGTRLDTQQWRHIAAHPLIASRVLRDMVGAGKDIADTVLMHHERLDGFGYPQGVKGEALSLNGQILAASEWLMGLVESGVTPLLRASMAARLVPGEFAPALLDAVSSAARTAPDMPIELASAPPLEQMVPRILRIAGTLERFHGERGWIEQQILSANAPVRLVLESGLQRIQRIRASFSSTGLDTGNPVQIVSELASLQDARVYAEIVTLVGEMEWRMRELEREQRLRAGQLDASGQSLIAELVGRLKGPKTPAVAATG
ncbi:HD-GYP domain-containing protein [Piscinibacter sp. HJYY11]|uniref:HD-GYP domain-containing protein n=1 Tax=Piscinibacter sp. HJYY11 TaxID=2801333 RepID=UPI00191EACAC|nr:HD domain-containing phosphohydrolase [Piscinibacter sp. HJYY11]MBL0726642.1 HD domain-containing protein [Piscinibacter sp. HJYY11]